MSSPPDARQIRAIASAHRLQIITAFVAIVSLVLIGNFMELILFRKIDPGMELVLGGTVIVILWATSVLLASRMQHSTGLVMTILMTLVPGLNIVMWFWLNMRATSILRRAGVKVGFFGASSKTLPAG